jgi:hypothetical protein
MQELVKSLVMLSCPQGGASMVPLAPIYPVKGKTGHVPVKGYPDNVNSTLSFRRLFHERIILSSPLQALLV